MAVENKIFGFDTGKLLASVVTLFIGIIGFDGERLITEVSSQSSALHDLDNKIGTMNAGLSQAQEKIGDHEGRLRILEKEIITGKPISEPIRYCESFGDSDVQACSP